MYKNWENISRIEDKHFMMALALLDLSTDFGRMVAERFPEYFSKEQQAKGPIPLSVLQTIAEENAAREHNPGYGAYHLVLYDAIPGWMPMFWFATDELTLKEHSNEVMVLPKDLESLLEKNNHTVGIIYKWRGKDIILVDFLDTGEWFFVPAEIILINH